MILQYKDCFDEALAPIFLYPYRQALRLRYRSCVLLCAPSSKQMLEKRGFLPVRQLFEPLRLPIEEVFIKKDERQQRYQHREERANVKNSLALERMPSLDRRIVLIDDVATTGSTLTAMQALLDVPLEALVLAVHPLLIPKRNDRFRQRRKAILKKK